MAEIDRILGYFLDEAQEHLCTIEEGLIAPASLAETAKIKEVFRAAHSIKGGAAMLGLEVVHQISNHFEQAFKSIKDRSIPVDEKLQDLLLEGLEILRLSIQMVQHGQVVPNNLVQEPVFAKIAKRIQRLGGDRSVAIDDSDLPFTDPAIEQVFGNYVNQKLQQFVDICKKTQPESITKQELQPICQKIGSLGESFEYLAWTNLLISCRLAVNNPLNGVVQLREVIPNSIRQAQMLVMAGKHHAITSTPELEILLAPNAINSSRSHTDLDTYDTLDSIDSVWDNMVITAEEISDLRLERSQPTTADFLFEPQMVSTETIAADNEIVESDSELEEFMQLFDEDISFDGTWVQNEDVLQEEELPAFLQPDESANLWDEDIAARPIVNSSTSAASQLGQQLPQFDFEQMSDSELFVEDVTDTALKPSPVMPTAAVDWSGLLADIPDKVIVDYQGSSQISPNVPPDQLARSLDKHPLGLSSGLELPSIDQIFNQNFNQDMEENSDPFLTDFADLSFGLDLESPFAESMKSSFDPFSSSEPIVDEPIVNEPISTPISKPIVNEQIGEPVVEILKIPESSTMAFSPPDHPDLKPIDADYLKELAMFDDLLADTKTTDVDLADLEQMIINGNLEEEELDLENIEDFSPASVNSKINSKLLINFDFLTEAKMAGAKMTEDKMTEAKNNVNNTTNSHNSTDYQDAHTGADSTTTTVAANVSAAMFATERAATEAELGLEDLDLLDLSSIEDLNSLDQELDDVLAGLNMLDIDDTELPSGSLIDFFGHDSEPMEQSMVEPSESISELFMDEFDTSGKPLDERAILLPHSVIDNLALKESLYNQNDTGDLLSLALSDLNLDDNLESLINKESNNQLNAGYLSFLDDELGPVPQPLINEDNELLSFGSLDLEFNNINDETPDEFSSASLMNINLESEDFSSNQFDLDIDAFDINQNSESEKSIEQSYGELFNDLSDLDLVESGLAAVSEGDRQDDFDQLMMGNLADLEPLEFGISAGDQDYDFGSLELSGLENLDDLLADNNSLPSIEPLAENSLSDLDGLLAEDTFGDLDAFLTVPPSVIPAAAVATAVVGAAAISNRPVQSPLPTASNTAKAARGKQRTFEQTMRVSVKNLNNLNNLTGELVVNRNTLEQDQNRMRQFIDKLLLEVQKLNEVGKSMQDLYEKSLLESSLLASRQQNQQAKSMVPGDNNSGDAEYDPLEMDKFTPVHLISQQMIELTVRIRESTSDIEFVVDSSTEVTRSLRQITSQLQEDLNKSRMLPFSQTSDRLQRGVRDNGLKYGKEVDLQVEGSDTLIDKVILESLNDPLVHMVNNAIAHGIESPADRLAAGKPAEGVITINATHQGTQTIISVKDDGAGIDTDRVKNKAIEKGIITPARAVTMTKQEVYELLFLPSFSTKDQADELAGRGVGMDVVLSSLQEIRGTITTESKLGEGTTFTIRLPLALSITKALMASNKDVGIAFPMDGIEDSLAIKPYSIIENEAGQKFFPWRDQQMAFRPLSDLLAFNRPMKRVNYYGGGHEDAEQTVSIIVLRSGTELVAVEVDRVIGEQEIVIKPLQGPAPKPLGIAGATVLGDGRIIPIADVLELVDIAAGKLEKHINKTWSMGDIPEDQSTQREPMVLVVDDSITVRQLLSLTFTKAGYRVEQARDGQEAWDKLRAGLPCDIIFCDIEMPRMDGLELLSKVQADEIIRKIPMAMLTSRGSDRHRQIASQLGASGYFIKPYLEDALLEAVKRMLKGEVLAIV
jgi:chemotaxis protein histidine kinase CheA/ActR/RegA family two-component response regulator